MAAQLEQVWLRLRESSLYGGALIEGAIEQEHVDARLAEDVEIPALGVGGDGGEDYPERQTARFGHTGGLQPRVRRADVRIESAARGRDGIGRHGCIGREAVGGPVGGGGPKLVPLELVAA